MLALSLLLTGPVLAQKPAREKVYRPTVDTATTSSQSTERTFDRCPPVQLKPTGTCVVLDARRSVDTLAAPLTYRWQMGDGHTREGTRVDYCYARAGRYTVELDVLDQRTGEVRRREEQFVLDFTYPDADLVFEAPTRAHVGEPVLLTLKGERLPACVNPEKTQFNWDFRDGYQAQGRSATHIWRRPGTFIVRLSVDGLGMSQECLPRQCVSQEIVIDP